MNFFEKEMRQMFDDNDIFQDAKFVGKTMLAKLDEDLRIKLQFIASHISGQYDTVQMTIINRTEGVVDKQNFKFSDIIGKCIRPGRESLDYHMWEYNNKPEWYTPISLTDKARIADTVMDYAEMYVGQSMTGQGMSMYATVPVTYNPIALAGSYAGAVSVTEAVTVDADNAMSEIKFGKWEGTLTFYINLTVDPNYVSGNINKEPIPDGAVTIATADELVAFAATTTTADT